MAWMRVAMKGGTMITVCRVGKVELPVNILENCFASEWTGYTFATAIACPLGGTRFACFMLWVETLGWLRLSGLSLFDLASSFLLVCIYL
jgi:hypothetical protein